MADVAKKLILHVNIDYELTQYWQRQCAKIMQDCDALKKHCPEYTDMLEGMKITAGQLKNSILGAEQNGAIE